MTADIVKTEPAGLLAVPDFMKGDAGRGLEHLKKDDLQIPRLSLAQGLSPQLVESDAKYVDGLRLGDMYNSITGQVYGKGPLTFAVVRADPPRAIEFYPLESGGGIKDRDVPLTDPRVSFGKDGEKPVATKFYDYVAVLLPSREWIGLSFKSSSLKTARILNTLMKLRSGMPMFGGLYVISSVAQKKAIGASVVTYYNFDVKNAGNITDEAEYNFVKGLYESISDRVVVVDKGDLDPDAPGAETEM